MFQKHIRAANFNTLVELEQEVITEVNRRLTCDPTKLGIGQKRNLPGYLDAKRLQRRISAICRQRGLSWREAIDSGLNPELFRRFFSLKEKFLPRSKNLGAVVLGFLGIQHNAEEEVKTVEVQTMSAPQSVVGFGTILKPRVAVEFKIQQSRYLVQRAKILLTPKRVNLYIPPLKEGKVEIPLRDELTSTQCLALDSMFKSVKPIYDLIALDIKGGEIKGETIVALRRRIEAFMRVYPSIVSRMHRKMRGCFKQLCTALNPVGFVKYGRDPRDLISTILDRTSAIIAEVSIYLEPSRLSGLQVGAPFKKVFSPGMMRILAFVESWYVLQTFLPRVISGNVVDYINDDTDNPFSWMLDPWLPGIIKRYRDNLDTLKGKRELLIE